MTCTKTISELVSELTPVVKRIMHSEMTDIKIIMAAMTIAILIIARQVFK